MVSGRRWWGGGAHSYGAGARGVYSAPCYRNDGDERGRCGTRFLWLLLSRWSLWRCCGEGPTEGARGSEGGVVTRSDGVEVVAFLLDRGAAEFVRAPEEFGEPWAALVAALVAVEPLERAAELESVLATLDEGDEIQAAIQAALEARMRHRRERQPLESVPAAMGDEKEMLEGPILARALQEEEDGDALVFATLYDGQVAYDHSQPKNGWHLWNGQYWQEDQTNAVINLLRTQVAAQYVYQAAELIKADKAEVAKEYQKRAVRLHTRRRKEHVLWGAASLPQIALTGDEWNSNPWLLGTENGTIDLQTGEFRPGQPTDWIKSVAPTEWQGIGAPAPRWERFLREIFDGDEALVAFFHRLLGYGITGLNIEHAFPVLWGPQGRNGKSTVLETLAYVLGPEMTMSIPATEIMHGYRSGAGGPQPYVAKLRGKRLAWSAETNPDRRLDAETVKLLTGGDRIHARAMYSNPVEFEPSHLLLLLTNYRPKIESADLAIWDRVHLIEFGLRFVEHPQKPNERPRDTRLRDKLRAEASGILAWLVRGCLAWQEAGGLLPPASVNAATDEYREEEDTVSQFVEGYLVVSPDARVGHREVYREYVRWCKDLKLWHSGSRDFSAILSARFGFEYKRTNQGMFYFGLGLPINGPARQMVLEE